MGSHSGCAEFLQQHVMTQLYLVDKFGSIYSIPSYCVTHDKLLDHLEPEDLLCTREDMLPPRSLHPNLRELQSSESSLILSTREAHRRLSSPETSFYGGWSCQHRLSGSFPDSRLPEEKQGFSTKHTVCPNCPDAASCSYQPGSWVPSPKPMFPDAPQGPTWQGQG